MPAPRRNFDNLIEAFRDAIEESSLPKVFREWAGISAIAGAMGRRCWYDYGAFKLYPNLFIALVAGPGRGKSVSLGLPFDQVYRRLTEPIGVDKRSWGREWEAYGMEYPLWSIQDRITPEKLSMDMKSCEHLLENQSTFNENKYEAALTLVTSEFGAFMNRNDHYLQMFMTDMWDSKSEYSYRTKTSGIDTVHGPCLNWIACATPDQFVENLPNNARSQGLLSRFIIVYWGGDEIDKDIYYKGADNNYVHKLVQDLSEIALLEGEFKFDCEETKAKVQEWVKGGMHPVPHNPNMVEYNERRLSHLFKVVMAVSAAKRSDLLITLDDWEFAKSMLLKAEREMPKALTKFGMSDVGRLATELLDWLGEHERGVSWAAFHKEALMRVKSPADVASTLKSLDEAGLIKSDGRTVWRK